MARNRSPSPTDMRSVHSGSPATHPQSKRDKRRQVLSEKLSEMVLSFNTNLRPHYEAQANAIQVDINLIHRADPYQNQPLEDGPQEIAELIRSTLAGKIPADPVAEGDFLADAGKLYTKFVHDVNDAMEDRDVNLTLLHNKHKSTMSELDQRYNFSVRMAHEEHRLLSNTIRERLIAQLSRKRDRLMKEKDMLDIGDSNALLLHPNQYSLINPASPGNGHKRATRNTGRRGMDPDDPSEIRRKRQRMFEDPETNSPSLGPTRVEMGIGSPYRDAKAKTVWHQQEAPLLSIDRLFTEKELSMTMNTAAIAARQFMLKLQSNGHVNGQSMNGAPDVLSDFGAGTANDAEAEDESNPAAPEMERTGSHHATRGTTKALLGLASLATGDVPFGTIIPTYIPAALGAKANGAPPMVAPLSNAEAEQDMAMIYRVTNGDDEDTNNLIRRTLGLQPVSEYQYRAPNATVDEKEELPNTLLPPGGRFGGLAMSRQSSQGGKPEALPMSRQNSGRGVAMQRTASGLSRRGRW